MRWTALALRIVGWLLTPLVAWAASFLGAWLVLLTLGTAGSPRALIGIALGAALLAGIVALLLWRKVLKRFPKLRHSLHVSTEGLPVMAEPPAADSSPAPGDGKAP
jgi:hypothetical protein